MADEMLFYGVWPGQPSGHYLRCSTGRERLIPKEADWAKSSGAFESKIGPLIHPSHGQQEGVWHIRRYSDVVVLTCWDRSGDWRYGSFAAFIWPGQHTDEEMMAEAKRLYPRVFQRIAERLAVTAGQP